MQVLPGLEEGDHLTRDFNGGSRSWVPARASLAMLEREDAKASDSDAISPGKCSPNRREDGFDNALDMCRRSGLSSATLWISSDFVIAIPRLAAPHP